MKNWLSILLLSLFLIEPSCKKNVGSTISISFDVKGRILSDCDSTPVANYPVEIAVEGYRYMEDDNYKRASSFIYTTPLFYSDANGYYHIQTTVSIEHVTSLSTTYNIVNDRILNGIQVFAGGPGIFHFNTGTLTTAYLKKNLSVIFYNGNKIYIKDTANFFYDTTEPLFLHYSTQRDSNIFKRIEVDFGKGCNPCPNVYYSDSSNYSALKVKTWYTYEVKLKSGNSFILKKDSFFTGCNSTIKINL